MIYIAVPRSNFLEVFYIKQICLSRAVFRGMHASWALIFTGSPIIGGDDEFYWSLEKVFLFYNQEYFYPKLSNGILAWIAYGN